MMDNQRIVNAAGFLKLGFNDDQINCCRALRSFFELICTYRSRGKWVVARTGPWLEPGSPDDALKSVPEHLNSSGTMGFGPEGGCLGAEPLIGSSLYYFIII